MIDVAGVILVWRERRNVLLQHRDEKEGVLFPGCWCFPGGKVEAGESFEAAARRELLEETGYMALKVTLLLEEEYVRSDGVRRHIYWAVYDGRQEIFCNGGVEIRFIARGDGGEGVHAGAGADDWHGDGPDGLKK